MIHKTITVLDTTDGILVQFLPLLLLHDLEDLKVVGEALPDIFVERVGHDYEPVVDIVKERV
jgi:hypothetical protein